jgi:hypothetical protein
VHVILLVAELTPFPDAQAFFSTCRLAGLQQDVSNGSFAIGRTASNPAISAMRPKAEVNSEHCCAAGWRLGLIFGGHSHGRIFTSRELEHCPLMNKDMKYLAARKASIPGCAWIRLTVFMVETSHAIEPHFQL